MTRIVMLTALLLTMPAAVDAQRTAEPGGRVRVHLMRQPHAVEGAVGRQMLRGTLVSMTPDSLLLRLHPATGVTAIARTGIARLDVSRGVPSRLESAAVSGATFAAVRALQRSLFAALDRDSYEGETRLETALIGAAGGALIGIVVGAVLPQERWSRLRNW